MGFCPVQHLHTRHLEDTARALAGAHDRVLVRNKNVLWQPIRLRRAKLADLAPFIVLNPPAFDSELAAWNERGGMLIYDRAYQRAENIAAHHAQFIVECPLSVQDLDNYVDGTRDLAVIYRPPSWREHERCVGLLWPSAELCRRYYDLVQAAPKSGALAKALDLPEGFTVANDDWMSEQLGLSTAELWRVRNATFRMRDFRMVNQVIPRIAPEDRTLAELYHYIVREFPAMNGVHLIVGSALTKAARHWKVALRDLARCGAIERKETFFCHLPDVMPPHWFKIDAEHRRAKERLEEMIARVEASAEFSPKAALRSPSRSDQSRSSPA